MSFPGYEHYKYSGVEWLGNIPDHWSVGRLKLIADVYPSNVDKKEYDDEVAVRLCNYTDVYYNDVITQDMELMRATASPEQVEKFTLRSGDTLLTKDSETADDIAISAYVPHDMPGVVCGYHLSIARPKPNTAGTFIKRVFDAAYIRAQSEVSANGLTRVGLSKYALNNLLIAYPGQHEQSQIALFLDRETTKIDALIEEKRQLIELLKEKRQAVISHAVTKGLNPNVPMTDSGVHWLNEIPAHWSCVPLRYLVRFISGGTPNKATEGYWDGNIPWLSAKDMKVSEINGAEDHITERAVRETGLRIVEPDHILVVVRGMILLHSFPVARNIVPVTINQDLKAIKCGARILPSFLQYLFTGITKLIVSLAGESAHGTKKIEIPVLSSLQIPLPPLEEQRAVSVWLEGTLDGYDSLLDASANTISLLRERRSALISAAVTGKIDVRTHLAKPVTSVTRYESGFAHQLLAAKIIDSCNGASMGRIKLQKLIHLCEYHGQLDEVEGDYTRRSAGPFDGKAMAKCRAGLEEKRWFEEVKAYDRYAYRSLEKCGEHKAYLAQWTPKMARIDAVLRLLGKARTKKCEIVSTLYAAWNDLLIDGLSTDDAAILHEASSAERWHKSKEKIAAQAWRNGLQWMKDNGLIPVGYGKHTKPYPGHDEGTVEAANEPA